MQLGNTTSIINANFPVLDESYLKESAFTYPVAINGKKRTEIKIDLNISQEDLEKIVLEDSTVQKWLEGGACRPHHL